ncbi:MAG TPA: GNAT family protein [Mycobacteriales bacterium]|nr:GNAT family protein [Mycobacteriales bacterium]
MLPLDLGVGLALHATTETDAEEAFPVVDAERARLREWLPWVDSTVTLAVEQDYLRSIEQANDLGAGLHATIRLDGGFGGFIGLRLNAAHRSAEVGYWLSERCVGRGVMTRAVAAMCDLAFGPLQLHRFELLAATGNTRSRAIAERLGMSLEGIRREAEELPTGLVDLAMYAVLSQDWPGGPAVLSRLEPSS